MAVDDKGTVYVADDHYADESDRVVALPAGSAQQTVLPYSGTGDLYGIAVDSKGNVYLSDPITEQVMALRAGSSVNRVLQQFPSLTRPHGLAVDNEGTVFIVKTSANEVMTTEAL